MTIPLPGLDLQQLGPEQSLRAFIGWWPDAQTRLYLAEQAVQAQAIYGGRMMHADHFHLTLRDVFEKPQVVWAGPDESQGQALTLLEQWHEDIWARLTALGWTQPPRRFRPHVSLLRHARIAADQSHRHALPTQAFVGDGVGLIVSVPGEQRSQYHLAATVNPGRAAS